MITLFPCRKDKKDARLAFIWRNDPKTVASSYIRQKKTWDAFWMEYRECYFSEPALSPVFIMDGNIPSGFIRFEKKELPEYPGETAAEVMINIAPECRGQGIGTQALFLLRDYMKEKGISLLLADIRKTNRVSQIVFEKTGFSFFSERIEYIAKTQENCCIVCYLCLL